jgi:biofilm PGA synthesis protein PgaA
MAKKNQAYSPRLLKPLTYVLASLALPAAASDGYMLALDMTLQLPQPATLAQMEKSAAPANLAQPACSPNNLPADPSAPSGEAQYQSALQLAREGKAQDAFTRLAILRCQHADDLRIYHDYIALAVDAGRNDVALAEAVKLDKANTPPYVLEAVARAARNSKQPDIAIQFYDAVLTRTPARSESALGKIYTLSDAGRNLQAETAAESALAIDSKNARLWEAYAYVLRSEGRLTQSLEAYHQVRELDPASMTADLGRINMLSALGAPHKAMEIAEARPDLLKREETLRLQGDRAAAHVRWSDADADRAGERFRNVDIGLNRIDALIATIRTNGVPDSPPERREIADKIVALDNRQRYAEAVQLYQALSITGQPVPSYARNAAADAYLGIKQPRQAKALYEQLIVEEPGNLKHRYGLFYALSDLEEHEYAQQVIEEVVRREPPVLDKNIPALARPNPGHVRARTLAMMSPAYSENLPEANRRGDELVAQVPHNMDVRTNRGSIYNWRGWPRYAEEEFRWVLATTPDNTEARLGRVTTLAAMNDWKQSDAILAEIAQDKPDDKQVKNALRRSQVHHLRELAINGEAGNSSQTINSSRDRVWDMRLYSQPIDDTWRVYGRLSQALSALPDDANVNRRRGGIGLEYKARDWLANADVTRAVDESRAALALSVAHDSDRWRWRAGVESSDENLPAKAAAAGIRARNVFAAVTLRESEIERAGVDMRLHDFSDGNRRSEWGASYSRMFSAEYNKRFTAGVALSGMHNSLQGTPYFNPRRAIGAEFSLGGEWLQWRAQESSLWHRVSVSAGAFNQDSYDTLPTARIAYELDWTASDLAEYRLGFGRGMHPYDGVQDFRNFINFGYNRRF